MADTGTGDTDQDLALSGRRDVDFDDLQRLAGTECYGST
jgi:hypothetical protein